MSFGANLKKARLDKGLTQLDIALQLGIDKSTYCGYETGKRQPDVKRIKELSSLLGVTADSLLGTENYFNYVAVSDSAAHRLNKYADAINNRKEIEELLKAAINCSTDDVWKLIEILRIINRGK